MKNNYPVIGLISAIILIGGISVFLYSKNKKATPPTPNNSSVTTTTTPVNVTQVIPHILNIKLTKSGFEPSEIEVKIGEGVTWTNESGTSGSVNSDDHPTHRKFSFLNLGLFENGTSVQATFQQAGTFTYHNHFKPQQKGTIVVKQ